MHQTGRRSRRARRVLLGRTPDERRLDERGPTQPASCGPGLTGHGCLKVARRRDEAEVRVTQGLTERRRSIPRRWREALNVPQARGREDSPSLLEHRAAPAPRLLLELDRHAWPHMGVIQAVHGALGARQRVQVRDKLRVAIDTETALGSERRPVDALAQQRDPGEPPAGWNQALQAPIRCDEKGDPDAGIALEQPLQAPERSAAEVAAGVELVPRGCRMDVVDI